MSKYVHCRGTDNCQCTLTKEDLEKASRATGMDLLAVVCPIAECKHGYHSHPSHDVAVAAAAPSSSSSSSSGMKTPPPHDIGCNGGKEGKCDSRCVNFVLVADSDEDLCTCGHYFMNHVHWPPRERTMAQQNRDHGSFRKRLLQRTYFTADPPEGTKITCQICSAPIVATNLASRFVDVGLRDVLNQKFFEYMKSGSNDPKDKIPISINSVENGMHLCGNCSEEFNSPRRLIRIMPDGVIKCDACMVGFEPYKSLHGKKVPWADKINTDDYPSSQFLAFQDILPKLGEKQ